MNIAAAICVTGAALYLGKSRAAGSKLTQIVSERKQGNARYLKGHLSKARSELAPRRGSSTLDDKHFCASRTTSFWRKKGKLSKMHIPAPSYSLVTVEPFNGSESKGPMPRKSEGMVEPASKLREQTSLSSDQLQLGCHDREREKVNQHICKFYSHEPPAVTQLDSITSRLPGCTGIDWESLLLLRTGDHWLARVKPFLIGKPLTSTNVSRASTSLEGCPAIEWRVYFELVKNHRKVQPFDEVGAVASSQAQEKTNTETPQLVKNPTVESSSSTGDFRAHIMPPQQRQEVKQHARAPEQELGSISAAPCRQADALGLSIVRQRLQINDTCIEPTQAEGEGLPAATFTSLGGEEAEVAMSGAVDPNDVLISSIAGSSFQERLGKADTEGVEPDGREGNASGRIQPWALIPRRQLPVYSIFTDPGYHMRSLEQFHPEAKNYYTTKIGLVYILSEVSGLRHAIERDIEAQAQRLTGGQRQPSADERAALTEYREQLRKLVDTEALELLIQYGGTFPEYDHTCLHTTVECGSRLQCDGCRVKYPEDLKPLRILDQWDEDETAYWRTIWERGKNTWDNMPGFEGLYTANGPAARWGLPVAGDNENQDKASGAQ